MGWIERYRGGKGKRERKRGFWFLGFLVHTRPIDRRKVFFYLFSSFQEIHASFQALRVNVFMNYDIRERRRYRKMRARIKNAIERKRKINSSKRKYKKKKNRVFILFPCFSSLSLSLLFLSINSKSPVPFTPNRAPCSSPSQSPERRFYLHGSRARQTRWSRRGPRRSLPTSRKWTPPALA